MKSSPPPLLLRFFKWFCHPDLHAPIEGDLIEIYEDRLANKGKLKSDLLLLRDILLLFRKNIIKPTTGTYTLNHYGMLKNYFKTGIRTILRYKGFSFINVFGLAVAMAIGLLIILMLNDQLQQDQFHTKKDNMYRVITKVGNWSNTNASSPAPLADKLQSDYPEVQVATSLVRGVGGDLFYEEGKSMAEVRGFFTDDSFFDVFDFELTSRASGPILSAPRQVVLSQEAASKLFADENPIGKQLSFNDRKLDIIKFDLGSDSGEKSTDWGQFMVTGVIDFSSAPSHLIFDALVSLSTFDGIAEKGLISGYHESWFNHSQAFTYVLLQDQNEAPVQFQSHLDELSKEQYGELEDPKNFIAQSLDEIRLGEFLGNPTSLQLPKKAYYFLAALALLVLLSAFINYANLSIARSVTRSKEIGIRKVTGARRFDISLQFIIESVLISLIALLIAIGLLTILRPSILSLWVMDHLHFSLRLDLEVLLLFVAFATLVGVTAGLYPSLVLSRYAPITAIHNSKVTGKQWMRRVLNTSQFVFSLLFIVSALLLSKQFKHFATFDHGMEVAEIINVPLQGNDFEQIKSSLIEVPGVTAITASQSLLATPNSYGENIRPFAGTEEEWFNTEVLSVDPTFVSTFGLELAAGNTLKPNAKEVVINAFGARELGFENPSKAVGAALKIAGREQPHTISGVLKDFKFQTPVLGEGDKSLMLIHEPQSFRYANIRITSQDLSNTLIALNEKWEKIDPVHLFRYEWYDQTLAASNQWMGDLATIIGSIAVLAVIISCLGLLGMAIYTTERRVKEIGIRKVLGAQTNQLAMMLSKSYVYLLLVAVLLAAPLSYIINSLWLDSIPNRVDIGIETLFLGSSILLAIGLVTILSQVLKISKTNPVESLKDE